MSFNSDLFERIRIHPEPDAPVSADATPCDHENCRKAGEFRAPMGRGHEGRYFCFCIDHVREYNAHYNYFAGMSDEAVARFQKDAITGHRPTWGMGTQRPAGAHRADQAEMEEDILGLFRNRFAQKSASRAAPVRPQVARPTLRALNAMGLDEHADPASIRQRYKDLVKRLHPDANGGDRSSEDKLREIINAYKHLRTVRRA